MSQIKEGFRGLTAKQLKLRLLLLFILLLTPSSLLIYKALTQLQWESFHQNRILAEEFSTRMNQKLSNLIELEQSRKFTDYSFLNIAGDIEANVILRSPLSEFPVNTQIPGLLGYFQIDGEGSFSSTYLPNIADYKISKYGISTEEYIQRKALQDKLFEILSKNQLLNYNNTIKTVEELEAMPGFEEPSRTGNSQQGALAEQKTESKVVDSDSMSSDKPQPASVKLQALAASNEPASAGKNLNQAQKRDELIEKRNQKQKQAKKDLLTTQQAFDRYSQNKTSSRQKQEILGRVDQLRLNEELAKKSSIAVDVLTEEDSFSDEKKRPKAYPKKFNKEKSDDSAVVGRRSRIESNVLPASQSPVVDIKDGTVSANSAYRLNAFQSEIGLFEFGILENGYLIIFRNVWKDDNRYIQGALIESTAFLRGLIETDFNATSLSNISNLTVALDETVLAIYSSNKSKRYLKSSQDITGDLLYKNRFAAPFTDLQLIFSVEDIAIGQGDTLIIWISIIIIIVLCLGFYMVYRLGMEQIELLNQQQDFVSAVSHELKTPLTSIRMYGEMLREGWVSEEKQKEYYDYIYDESERLTRLINNVLQLSKLSREDLHLQLHSISVAELMDHIRAKISSQIENSEFSLSLDCDQLLLEKKLMIDIDAFTQIIINLVDNAIKFSKKGSKRMIDIGCKFIANDRVQFSVRDYGPGIENSQMNKIFKLFYRAENELTRETIGTGIGLALVNSLVTAMDGVVDVVNKNPGVEFRVSFSVIS
jgi:signal transduction histidine kinase